MTIQDQAREIAEISFKFWNDGDTPTSWDGTEELIDQITAALTACIEDDAKVAGDHLGHEEPECSDPHCKAAEILRRKGA